eukprot:scaffold57879_cov47-Phaeocystis_antarctica.AAC.1
MDAFRRGMYRFYLRQRDLPAAATRTELARRAHADAAAPAASASAAQLGATQRGAAQLGAAACSLDPCVRHGVYVSVMPFQP